MRDLRDTVTLPRHRWDLTLQIIKSIGWKRAYPLAREIEAQLTPNASERTGYNPAALVNGGLYLVRWNHTPDQPDRLAVFITNQDECELDEEPNERWEFFGTEMTGPIGHYDVITRLDVVPVDWMSTEAGTWPDDY